MTLYVIVLLTLITSVVGSALALRAISNSSNGPSHVVDALSESRRKHPAGKGLNSEEDVLRDI